MISAEFERLKRLGACSTQLLADKTFCEIIADLKSEAIRNWSAALSPEKREEYWYDLQAVGRLENLMKAYGQQYRAETQKIEAVDRRRKAQDEYREAARG